MGKFQKGHKTNVGRKHSEETKEKMSISSRGEKNPMYGRRGELAPMWGKYHSEETKAKISKNNHWKGRPGEEHPRWKGGRIDLNGYVLIYSPNHPYCSQGKYVLEHRLVMEKHLRRYLYPWEIVHHKNGIKDDNRIENLELIPHSGEHNTQIQKIYLENQKLKIANLILLRLLLAKGEQR